MIDQLRQRFEQPGVRLFRRDRLDMVELSNAAGSTVITTLGATVLSYIPAGGDETIWVSDTACYDGSRPVRGGIPVCWPWFGAHPDDASLPAHGFARHAYWDLVAVESGDRSSLARFRLESDRETLRHWPHPFRLELVVTLGDALRLELQAHNPGTETWTISEALHSYFRVTDARRLTVSGLEGLAYWDKQAGGVRGKQDIPLAIDPPVDRVFFDHRAAAIIHDGDRDLRIDKTGSDSTVVWNPGPEGARSLSDMPDDDWPGMLCVETANALDNRYSLGDGKTHTLTSEIRVTTR